MPCQDLSERIVVKINTKNCLADYNLRKLTCAKSLGQDDLLINFLKNRSVDDILELNLSELFQKLLPQNEVEEFLIAKHLNAIQKILQAFKGQAVENVILEQIDEDEKETKIVGILSQNQINKKITPCSNSG